MIKRFALLLSALLSLGLHAQAQTFPSPTVQNFTVLGTMTASGLTTSGTIANSLCQTSAGTVLSVAGVNCFGGGGGGGISGLVAGQLSIAGSPTTLTSSIPFGVTGSGSFIPAASGGLLSPGVLPLASASSFGAAECDNTTITCPGGVFSAVSGGSGNVVSPGSGFTVGDLIKANNTAGTAILDANVVAANVVTSSGTLTNNFILVGGGAKAVGQVASLGTTTTLLHGNAAGLPSFGPVALTTDVTGNLPVTNLNSGTSASSTTFWRGDATWATPSAGSAAFNTLTSGTNTTAAMLVGTGASLGPTGSGTLIANQVPSSLGTGSLCTTSGTLSAPAACPIVPTVQSGASFALVAGNAGQLVLATNASPTTVSVAQSTGSLGTGWGTDLFTEGNTSTVTPTTSKINNLTAIKLGAYQDIAFAADSAGNYVGALSVPQPPTQTNTTIMCDDFVWRTTCAGILTASGSITNGSLGIWASGTSLSGTVVPGTGVLTFLATPSSANLAAAVTGETGTGALVFGTSPTLTTPTINGGTMGAATPWTIAAGTPTAYVGLDASNHMVTGTPAGTGTVTNLTLAPGFTTTIGTQNTAGQNITTTGTINGQLWPEPQTVNYTVLTSDTGALPLANGSGSITFTLPNPATGTKGTTYQFNDESGHGYTMATVGATADFLGCSGGGGTTLAVSASTGVSVVDNGTSYSCLLYGGSGSGSGTVNSGVTPNPAYYATSGTAVSGYTHVTYPSTLVGIDYNVTALPTAQTGTVLQAANVDATATRFEADAFGAQAFFSGVCYGGTNASKTAITAGTQCGGYNSWLYNGTSVVGPLASLRTFANELQASAGTHGGTYLDITATPNGSQTPVSQMQIVPSAGGSGGGGGAGVNFALGTSHTPFALTDAATIAVDASKATVFSDNITANRTLGFPTNLPTTNQQTLVFEFTQDATGGRTLAFGSGYTGTVFLNPKPNAVTTFQCTSTSNAAAQCVGGFNAVLPSFTIGAGANQIPACSATYAGWRVYVTDGAATPVYNATQSGGGSTPVPVFCDGTNWTNH